MFGTLNVLKILHLQANQTFTIGSSYHSSHIVLIIFKGEVCPELGHPFKGQAAMFYPVFCLNTVITRVITSQLLSKPPIYAQRLISARLLLVTNTRSHPFCYKEEYKAPLFVTLSEACRRPAQYMPLKCCAPFVTYSVGEIKSAVYSPFVVIKLSIYL